jgi:hypothetical protein
MVEYSRAAARLCRSKLWSQGNKVANMRHSIGVFCVAGWLCAFSTSVADDSNVSDSVQIERMARFYRVQNYEVNRLDRAEYDRRGAELQQQLAAWEDSGRNPERTRDLLQWLDGSLGGDGARQQIARTTEALPIPRDLRIPAQNSSPPVSAELTPEMSGTNINNTVEEQRHGTGNLGIPSKPAPVPDDPTLSGQSELNSAATPTAPKLLGTTDVTPNGNSILGGIRSAIDDLVNRVEQVPAISKMPDSVPPPVTLPQLADVPDAPPFVSPAFQPQTEPKLNIDVPKIGGLAEMRSKVTRPDSKAAGAASSAEGKVNFTEVAALTRAYNSSLRDIETKLSKDTNWTVDALEPLVDELEDLALRRADLMLYDNLLPAEERSQLVNRDTLDQAVRLTGKRIADVRKALSEQTGGDLETRRDLAQLDGFSRRLAVLGGGKQR